MGSGSSKSSESSVPHMWKRCEATTLSSDLVEALQTSPETDVSRRQSVELEIQARVAAELKRLREQEAAALKEISERISAPAEGDEKSLSSRAVSKEVAALRAKLAERHSVRPLPDSVERARSEVVRCLIEKDRRPLDCWAEVEKFKDEVRRLERGWVDRVVS